MIITPNFVFLQMPRTGSTFCGEMIMDTIPEAVRYEEPPGRSKHNYRKDIPRECKNLTIAGVKRDHFELIESWACLGIWQTRHIDAEGVNRRIDFNEWYGRVKKQFNVDTGLVRAVYAEMFGSDTFFIDFADLNRSLYDFLKSYGYDNKKILARSPVNVNEKKFKSIPLSMVNKIIRAEA